MHLDHLLRRHGAVVSYRRLRELGMSRHVIDTAVRRGDLLRLRRGWYGLPSLDEATRVAMRVGGVVTCVSLLAAQGVWVVPHGESPHVAIPAHASGRLLRPGVVSHWTAARGDSDRAWDTVVGALRQCARCFGTELAVASADSAMRAGLLDERDLAALPAGVRRRVDPRCESGGESLVRQRLQALRLNLELQVQITGVGRVDFVVGDRLVIEVDGYAFHGTREAFERDRARDLALVAANRLVIRVSQRQVLEQWPRIQRAVLAIVRSGRHRWPRRAQ